MRFPLVPNDVEQPGVMDGYEGRPSSGWLTFGACDVSGRETEFEVKLRLETIEFWVRERLQGVFDRDVLRGWLADPRKPLSVDDVALVEVDQRFHVAVRDRVPWSVIPADVVEVLGARV